MDHASKPVTMQTARVIAVDDEPIALSGMRCMLSRELPRNEVRCFALGGEALDYARANRVDIAFVDITLRDGNGVELAQSLMRTNPEMNIIFTTGSAEYAQIALQMHVSGYITKPVSARKIHHELTNLRFPLESGVQAKLLVRCFGNFDVLRPGGEPVAFARSKSKELLAYLVSKRGTSVTVREACSVLFEDKPYDERQQNYIQQIISVMMSSLDVVGARDVIIKERGQLAIRPDDIQCDYYDLLDDLPEALSQYTGEFMSQYSWAETINAFLYQKLDLE